MKLSEIFEGYEYTPHEQPEPQPFLRTDVYRQHVKDYAGTAVGRSLRQFLHVKRDNPQALYGQDDRPFSPKGALSKHVSGQLRHAHLNADVSILYSVDRGVVTLYGLWPHKALGTGNPKNMKRQQQMAQRIGNMQAS